VNDRAFGRALVLAFAVGCGPAVDEREAATPVELTGAEVCAVDGMILRDYDGPKAQILWKDGRRTFYCEAREAFAEWTNRIEHKRIREFYVQDLADRPWGHYPGHWTRARDAVFVIESELLGAMGSSFVSFRDPAHAAAFSGKHGGRALRLEAITTEVFEASQQTHLARLIEREPSAGSEVRASRALMGTTFEIAAWVPSARDAATEELLSEALSAVAELEKRISSWDSESETSALNRAAGVAPIAVGADLRALVDRAAHWAQRTDGAFDITVSPIVELWRRAANRGARPTAAEIASILGRVGDEKILAEGETLFLSEPGMRVEFGAIGKGYAADRAAQVLQAGGVENFIVGAGGDLIVRGSKGAMPWQVGVRDPSGKGLFAVSALSGRAIATSGNYEQFISIGGHRYAHIFDPRSGEPASGLTSVTVLSARAVDSDALATALFAMGSDDGIKLVESLPDVEAFFISEGGSAILSSGLRLEDRTLEVLE
jgi:thiamine biosynthesis lipoprotein